MEGDVSQEDWGRDEDLDPLFSIVNVDDNPAGAKRRYDCESEQDPNDAETSAHQLVPLRTDPNSDRIFAVFDAHDVARAAFEFSDGGQQVEAFAITAE